MYWLKSSISGLRFKVTVLKGPSFYAGPSDIFRGQRHSHIPVLGLSVHYTAAVLVGALLVGQWADVGGLVVRYLEFGFWVL